MKRLAAAALALALLAGGCGGDEATTSETGAGPQVYPGKEGFATITDRGMRKPTVVPPDRLPPREVLSRDLEVGSGPVARRGDRVWVRYFGTNYKTGEEQYPGRWPPLPPLPLEFASSGEGDAWENGIVGMRVGGRRELIIPSHLLYRTGTIDYVVDLVRVKPPREKVRGG
jgi:peptidylprolyl isomerase